MDQPGWLCDKSRDRFCAQGVLVQHATVTSAETQRFMQIKAQGEMRNINRGNVRGNGE